MLRMPPSLRDRIAGIRKDLAAVLGRTPPPVLARTRSRQVGTSARPLLVKEVRRETADGTVIVLADPTGAPIRFVPGQFLTLQVTVDGAVFRRAYSICSDDAAPESVSVCAKRIAGGRVSTFLHDKLRAGDVIPVLGPSGEFTVMPSADAQRNLVLVAGGSGITPILAILRAVLAHEPRTRATLIYGNRRAEDVIHARAIDQLLAAHADRFTVRHVLEERGDGRLDRATVGALLDDLAPSADTDYFVCGPAAAMVAVKDELVARGVPSARLHEERFATPERKPQLRAAQRVTIRRGKQIADVLVAPDATLLVAGLAAGVDMPFSCTMGGCGACAVELTEGDVDHDEPNCLTPDERARGRVLACVARPNGPCTVVVP